MTAHDDADQDSTVAGFDAHVEESSARINGDVDGAVEDMWKFVMLKMNLSLIRSRPRTSTMSFTKMYLLRKPQIQLMIVELSMLQV
jgi:hypothetical protein